MAEVGKTFLVQIAGMVVRKNSKVKKYRGIEEGIVSVNFEDDFVNTEGWKSEVKVD